MNKADRTINEALGLWDTDNVTKLAFTGTTASGVMTAGTYRMVATEDAYVYFSDTNLGAADNNDTFVPANTPEVVQVDSFQTIVAAIRVDTSGSLYLTKLVGPGGRNI